MGPQIRTDSRASTSLVAIRRQYADATFDELPYHHLISYILAPMLRQSFARRRECNGARLREMLRVCRGTPVK
jgi:hypothetical protein